MSSIFVSHSEKDLAAVNEISRGLEQAGYRTRCFEREALNKAKEMCREMDMDYFLTRTEKALEKLQGVNR